MSVEHLIDEVVEGAKPSDVLGVLTEAVDKHAADELEMYINNDYGLYKQKVGVFAKNAITKVARGQYNSKLAEKLFLHLVDRAAQQYTKAYDAKSTRGGTSFGIFDKPTRMAVAKELVNDFEDEAKSGAYEELLPKKWQGKLSYPLKKL
jgi:hypothetical protein